MANQKLNEVTTVPTASINNVKTFLAVMNDNSIQQMTKEDMATVLGGLLPINGIIYKKNSEQPSWYLLCSVSGNNAVGIYVIANKYVNQAPTHISFSIVAYDSQAATLKAKINIQINNEYRAIFKYKKDGSTIKLWCNAGDILAIFSRTPSAVLVEQEPDGDAVDITGDI